MTNIFLEKSYHKCGGEASSILFYKKSKLSVSLDRQSQIRKWTFNSCSYIKNSFYRLVIAGLDLSIFWKYFKVIELYESTDLNLTLNLTETWYNTTSIIRNYLGVCLTIPFTWFNKLWKIHCFSTCRTAVMAGIYRWWPIYFGSYGTYVSNLSRRNWHDPIMTSFTKYHVESRFFLSYGSLV